MSASEVYDLMPYVEGFDDSAEDTCAFCTDSAHDYCAECGVAVCKDHCTYAQGDALCELCL